jgi:hypothetical protein
MQSATSKQSVAGAISGNQIPNRIPARAFEPETMRLPRPGEHDPHFGLARSFLNTLVLPTLENDFKPPVRSYVIRRRGARTGVRLIDYQSLKTYILAHAETGETGGEP